MLRATSASHTTPVGSFSTHPVKNRAEAARAHIQTPKERIHLGEVFDIQLDVLRNSSILGDMQNVGKIGSIERTRGGCTTMDLKVGSVEALPKFFTGTVHH